MTAQNPIFTDAAKTAVVLSEDEKIRLQCEAREDYYRRTGWKDEYIEQLNSENEQLSSKNKQLTSKNEQLTSKNEQLASENRRLYQLLKEAGISAAQDN